MSIVWLSMLGAACAGEDPSPQILTFQASAASVSRGRSVTLSWDVQDADRITVVAEPDEVLVDRSPEIEGRVLTPPITRTQTFTLKAEGNGESTASIRVEAFAGGDRPTIVAFDVEPASVAPGGSATLTWRTRNTTDATLTTADGTPVIEDVGLPVGSVEVTPDRSTTYALTLFGSGEPVTAMRTLTVRRPTVERFTANPESIIAGESTELAWAVSFADRVTVTDDGGNEVVSTTNLIDRLVISPQQTTTYTLVARDTGGLQDEAEVSVEVRPPQQAVVESFTATPDTVDIGEPVELAWSVDSAPGGVRIEAGGALVHQTSERTGMITVRRAATTTFTLTARSPGGDASADATVTVRPSPPAILDFVATPENILTGEDTVLSWSTLGATTLELEQGQTQVYSTTVDLDTGAVAQTVSTPTVTYTLIATNPDGSSSMSVTVNAFEPPEIQSFIASPLIFQGSANVQLDWAVTGATNLSLLLSGTPDPTFPGSTPSGTHTASITQTTLFELIARNPAAQTSRTVLVSESVGKAEPNDTPSQAIPLPAGGASLDGSIGLATDEDWFRINVPDGGNIRAETSDGAGGCAFDTVVTLFAPDGTTELGADDDSGSGPCSLIDPSSSAFARDMAPGAYFLKITGKGSTGTYRLVVSAGSPSCGNGLHETRAGEQCDDGPANGTGTCDNSCMIAVAASGMINGYGSSTFSGSISPAAERDYYQLDLTGPSHLVARTWSPSAPTCNADTVLTLYDASFTLLGANDQSGADDCSSIHPHVDAFATLSAGTYYLSVEEFQQDAVIPAYQVSIDVLAPGCGNGVIEGSETCDDANTTSSDGCSDQCQFEGLLESEPNDDRAAADAMGSFMSARGTIDAGGDVDWYSVSLMADWSLSVSTEDGFGTCRPEVGTVDTKISLYASDGSPLGSDDDGGLESCSSIDPIEDGFARLLPAGTYYVAVEHFNGTGTGTYEVNIDPIMPACGNGILETSIAEQCDDTNQITGDGCDACQFEILGAVDASSSTTTFSVPLASSGSYGVVQVDVAAGESIEVQTNDAGGACTIDTAVELIDGATLSVLGTTESGPLGDCAAIPYPTGFATNLSAGTYYVRVIDSGTTTGTSEVTVTFH